jgi:two-component system nitrogen regulation sensor histidine kinase NtrY
LDDTKGLTDGFYINGEETTLHYAKQLIEAIQKQNLIDLDRRLPLMEFVRNKLTEYKLDEIGVFVADEELFTYLNPDLPFQYYRDIKTNLVRRAHLGEPFSSIDQMGNGEMIRSGISFNIPNGENVLVVAGKFLPQNYAEKINNISAYVQRYSQLKIQKNSESILFYHVDIHHSPHHLCSKLDRVPYSKRNNCADRKTCPCHKRSQQGKLESSRRRSSI